MTMKKLRCISLLVFAHPISWWRITFRRHECFINGNTAWPKIVLITDSPELMRRSNVNEKVTRGCWRNYFLIFCSVQFAVFKFKVAHKRMKDRSTDVWQDHHSGCFSLCLHQGEVNRKKSWCIMLINHTKMLTFIHDWIILYINILYIHFYRTFPLKARQQWPSLIHYSEVHWYKKDHLALFFCYVDSMLILVSDIRQCDTHLHH